MCDGELLRETTLGYDHEQSLANPGMASRPGLPGGG
jgi:hypothetical protein